MVNFAKTLWHKAVPRPIREKLFEMRQRGRVLLNYALIRSSMVNWMYKVGAWPTTLYIEGANICNARCVFCSYPQMKRPKSTMTMEMFRNAVDQHLAMGYSEINLTSSGGEPFADRYLFERLDYLFSRPEVRRFHFNTNAILMKPEYIDRLVAYGERLYIYCSFGGFDRETYHKVMGVDKFEEAVANIRRLIDAKVRTGSLIGVLVNLRVPQGSEKGEFWDYLCRMRDAGIIQISGVDEFDNWGGKILDEELRAAGLVPKPVPARRGPCRLLLTVPLVLADGRINGCGCRDQEATLVIGDLKTQSLKEILSSSELKRLLMRQAKGDFPEVCKVCSYYQPVYPPWNDV